MGFLSGFVYSFLIIFFSVIFLETYKLNFYWLTYTHYYIMIFIIFYIVIQNFFEGYRTKKMNKKLKIFFKETNIFPKRLFLFRFHLLLVIIFLFLFFIILLIPLFLSFSLKTNYSDAINEFIDQNIGKKWIEKWNSSEEFTTRDQINFIEKSFRCCYWKNTIPSNYICANQIEKQYPTCFVSIKSIVNDLISNISFSIILLLLFLIYHIDMIYYWKYNSIFTGCFDLCGKGKKKRIGINRRHKSKYKIDCSFYCDPFCDNICESYCFGLQFSNYNQTNSYMQPSLCDNNGAVCCECNENGCNCCRCYENGCNCCGCYENGCNCCGCGSVCKLDCFKCNDCCGNCCCVGCNCSNFNCGNCDCCSCNCNTCNCNRCNCSRCECFNIFRLFDCLFRSILGSICKIC